MVNLDRSHSDRYATVADVATSCAVSKMTIYRLVQSGQLPAYRDGRTLLIKISDAEQVLGTSIHRLPTSTAGGSTPSPLTPTPADS